MKKHGWLASMVGVALLGAAVSNDGIHPPEALWADAEAGKAEAQFLLARFFEVGNGAERDPARALEWYQRAAEQGLAGAQSNLATLYAEGRGTAPNPREAFQWFRKAARQGLAEAQFNLGLIYERGAVGPRDLDTALEWYRRAAEPGGGTLSGFEVGSYHETVSVPWILASQAQAAQAREFGLAAAQYHLGRLFLLGEDVAQDFEKAASWLERAANQEHAEAQYQLGMMRAQGLGGKRNDAAAIEWLRRSAAQGYQPAQNNLGVLLMLGRGVERDVVEACYWFSRSAVAGNPDGQRNRERALRRLSSTEKAEVERLLAER